ncbi:hypothetical protein BDV23DRAFT_193037 [Aspergillus alliaceus]|uniref:AtmA protein n=1 Tax=Petromyces alliaceus TaxID=209559 RepID=A0A5N7CPX6_PETAA|nr:hypothetical protein BDV23DRAFT_193037 [Aspergillus alliaceus]
MAAKVILPFLSLFVFYAIFYFADINGLRNLGDQAIASKTLPGTNFPLRTVYTGVEPIDHLLTTLTTFFWPTTDYSHPSLFLHSISFSGTFGSAWILISLEAWRKGNAWTIAAFPMIFGLTAQVLTFAFAAPLYCFLHLIVTPTNPTPDAIRVPRSVLHAIPAVFVIGYLLPTHLLTVPLSEHITSDIKQIFIAIWQPWPAYVSILLTVSHLVFNPFTGRDKDGRANLSALRRVYAFAFANTALTHLVSWILSLGTVFAPGMYNEAYLEALHPRRVFEVPFPWEQPVRGVRSVGEGVHLFLRWDYIIGSAGVLVWAGALYSAARKRVYGKTGLVATLVKSVVLGALVGPVGAAVVLLWERDEMVVCEMGGVRRGVVAGGKKDS